MPRNLPKYKSIILFLLLSTLTYADINLAAGFMNGHQLQKVENSQGKSKTGLLSMISLEFDSYPVPLFFNNDYVAYGISFISEFTYQEKSATGPDSPYLMYYPIYFNYYFEISDNCFMGGGMSLGLSRINSGSVSYTLGQREGYHAFIRKILIDGSFLDIGFFSTSSLAVWDDEVSAYQLESIFVKYGVII